MGLTKKSIMQPTLKGMSDHQMEKRPNLPDFSLLTDLPNCRTGPEIFYRQGPDTWEIYDKMGITKNPSCSHEPKFKMHVWSSNGKKGQIFQILVYDRTYKTNFLQDRTRNIFQGPETWEIYDKMGITKNPSCSHESNFKMYSDCQMVKKAKSTRL